MNLSAMFIKILIFAVLLTLGYILARLKLLSPEFNRGASALLVNVFIPASVIYSVIGDRPAISNRDCFIALGLCTLTILICYVFAWVGSRVFKDREQRNQYEVIMAVCNNLFIGLPIVSAISGSEAAFYIGISCLPFNIALYTYGVWRLKSGRGEEKFVFKDLISACIVASIISIILFTFKIPVPKAITEVVATASGATVPVSMIVIGSSMGAVNPALAFGEWKNYWVSFIRLILAAVVTYFVCRLFTGNQVLLLALVVTAGCPVGAVTTPLSIKYGCNPENSACATMVSTVLSMITLPLFIKLFFA